MNGVVKLLGVAAIGTGLCLGMTAPPAEANEGKRTDIVMGVTLEPPHLDPTAGAAAAIDEIVYANVFEGLTRINESGQVKAGLAERWVIEDDGLTYRFILREGVTFHDGATLEASDVKFSLERAMAEDSVNAQKALFSAIASVDVVDDRTVIIRLSRKEGQFLWNLGWGDAVIVDPASADTNKTNPVGTGPFKLDTWVRGATLTLTENPAYWGTKPALNKVTFQFIKDPAAQVVALLAGDIDAVANINAPEMVARFQADGRFAVDVGTTEGETILSINHRRAPWNDVRVRRAIQHAIDRNAIIAGAMFGFGTPIGSHFAPHSPAYLDLTEQGLYDPEKAKALLAEAGVKSGTKAVIKLPPPTYARRGGEIIAAQLKAVGIELEIVPVEWGQWLAEVFKAPHDFDFTIVSHTEPLDIGIYARDDYYFGYDNPAFKELMKTVEETSNPAERYALYREAQQMLADEAVNGFLFQLAKIGVRRKEISGLWMNAPVQANDLTKVHWE